VLPSDKTRYAVDVLQLSDGAVFYVIAGFIMSLLLTCSASLIFRPIVAARDYARDPEQEEMQYRKPLALNKIWLLVRKTTFETMNT